MSTAGHMLVIQGFEQALEIKNDSQRAREYIPKRDEIECGESRGVAYNRGSHKSAPST